jgi:CO/xanthine dehydrogenase Mo-binding subunit
MPAQIHSIIMETPDPQGPFGARGMSEMPLVPFGAAVASAIHAATGAWVSDMPFTPGRVLDAIAAQRAAEAQALAIR